MKVPTYHKYGITKSQLEKFDERNRKISHLLTHRIPIAAGIVLGILFYIINFNKFAPQNALQVVSQLFLFVSIGILCVGVPMIIFKFAENYYYRHIEKKNETYMNILKFKKDKEDFDYWHIRSDERFWKLIDGNTFEREVTGVYKQLGYELISDINAQGETPEFILSKDGKTICMKFITGKIAETPQEIEDIVCAEKSKYDKFIVVLSKGCKPDLAAKIDPGIELVTTKNITAMVRMVGE